MIFRTYKYRAYPNSEQIEFLSQNFGAARFVWNQLVANFNSWTPESKPDTINEKILKDNPEFSWLNDAISYTLQQKRIDFDETKKQFFSKKRKVPLGRMKFKKRGISKDSIRIPAVNLWGNPGFVSFDQIRNGYLHIPKCGELRLEIDRKFAGKPKSITISRNKANQYFVSILVEEEKPEPLPNTYRAVGIDLGLKELATLSCGLQIENPRWFVKSQDKLKKARQHLSRKTKGSNRYKKQKLKVARIHNKISNQRSYFHHNVSKWIVTEFDYIYLEDLAVQEMMQPGNKTRNKNIADVGWSSLVSMIKYKADWYNKEFAQVDRYFASSQICSSCGHQDGKKPVSIREWVCPVCNEVHDRDLNAAINIEQEASKDLVNWIKRGNKEQDSVELIENRRGAEIRPPASLVVASAVKRLAVL